MKKQFWPLLAMSISAVLPGQTSGWSAPMPASAHSFETAQAATNPGYVLGADDIIEVTVANHDDLNKVLAILPDGTITMPRAGQVHAAGKTPSALAKEIETRLARTLNHAPVSIVVREVHSNQARISGAVKTAGSYAISPGFHLLDLVAQAGGFLTNKPERISGTLVRNEQDIPLDIPAAAAHPEGPANVALQPKDLVLLTERDIHNQVNVTGEVTKPNTYDLTENLNVISLLAQAGSETPNAALRAAYVQRAGERIPLDLYAILKEGKKDPAITNFRFQPGDVLVIPKNEATFNVFGSVVKAGRFPYPENPADVTVLKALAAAGGSLPEGDLKRAQLTRNAGGKPETITVDIDALQKGMMADTIILQPEDSLVIPLRRSDVHIIGKVNKPGVYEIKDNLTPISLVAQAGGPIEGAALSKAYVLRGTTLMPLNLEPVLIEGRNDPAVIGFQLEPGDVLNVPENRARFGVLGQVSKPGAFTYPENPREATLIKALTNAGGPAADADLKKATVVRPVEGGRSLYIPVNLDDVLRRGGAAGNMQLLPGDALFVPKKGERSNILTSLVPSLLYLFK